MLNVSYSFRSLAAEQREELLDEDYLEKKLQVLATLKAAQDLDTSPLAALPGNALRKRKGQAAVQETSFSPLALSPEKRQKRKQSSGTL